MQQLTGAGRSRQACAEHAAQGHPVRRLAQDGEREHTHRTWTKASLEQACAPLLKRLRAPVERALRDANLRSGHLDNIVLAGGATRMPIVRRLVTTMFGRFPSIDFNPDEVVALGAAVQAGLKAKDAALKEVVMTDVSPYSLGVEVSMRISETTASRMGTSIRSSSATARCPSAASRPTFRPARARCWST